jgi:hypothetical protein
VWPFVYIAPWITCEIREASSPTARLFWLYLQGHLGTHNGSLVGVLYAYNGHLTMPLVPCVTSVAKSKIRATMHMAMAMAMCGFGFTCMMYVRG